MGKQIKDLEVLSPATITDGDVIIVQRGDKSYQTDLNAIVSSGSSNLTEETVQDMIDASITTVLNTEV